MGNLVDLDDRRPGRRAPAAASAGQRDRPRPRRGAPGRDPGGRWPIGGRRARPDGRSDDLRRGRRYQGDGDVGARGGAPLRGCVGRGLRPARGDRHDLDRGDQRLRARWRVRARPRLRPALRGDRRDARSARDRARCDPGRRRDAAAGAAGRARAHPTRSSTAAGSSPRRRRCGSGIVERVLEPGEVLADRGRGRPAVRERPEGRRSPPRRRRSARRSARPARPASRRSGRPSWRCSARPISARGWRRSWRSASRGSAADRRSNSRHIRSISLSHPVATVQGPRRSLDVALIGNEPVLGAVRRGY